MGRRKTGSPRRKTSRKKGSGRVQKVPVTSGNTIRARRQIKRRNREKGLKTEFLGTVRGMIEGVSVSIVRFTTRPFKK